MCLQVVKPVLNRYLALNNRCPIMNMPIQFNDFLLKYFDVGSAWQNISFYAFIVFLLYTTIFLTRRKRRYEMQPATGVSESKTQFQPATGNTGKTLLKTNTALNTEIATLKKELLALGEELELSYTKSDRLNDQLSEILDCLELTVAYDQNLWDWSLDFNSKEITLSDYGLRIRGFAEGAKPTFNETINLVDPRHRQAVTDAIEQSFASGADFSMTYLINPIDGSRPKAIKAAGKVSYGDEGKPVKLSGTFALTLTEVLMKK
jgi:hypothetical protein